MNRRFFLKIFPFLAAAPTLPIPKNRICAPHSLDGCKTINPADFPELVRASTPDSPDKWPGHVILVDGVPLLVERELGRFGDLFLAEQMQVDGEAMDVNNCWRNKFWGRILVPVSCFNSLIASHRSILLCLDAETDTTVFKPCL